VSRSAPQRTSTTPTTIHKAFSNILFFLFYFYFFNDVSLGLSALGRSEIRIRQKAKSVSPMQKYEKTLNAKTFRAHFSIFDYKGKEQATIIRKTKRFSIPERAVQYLKTKRTTETPPIRP